MVPRQTFPTNLRVAGNVETTSGSGFSEDQVHILGTLFTESMVGAEPNNETKAVKAVGHMVSNSEPSPIVAPNCSVQHKTLSGSGFFSSSLKHPRGRTSTSTSENRVSPGCVIDSKHLSNETSHLRTEVAPEKRSNEEGRMSNISLPTIQSTAYLKDALDNGSHGRTFTTKGDEAFLEDHNNRHSRPKLGEQLRCRSTSVSISDNSVDHKGMHTLVLEAMKTIQRYESENEEQVYGDSQHNSLLFKFYRKRKWPVSTS